MPGVICDVSYEDLVADPPAQCRRLLDWCGLPWQDDVLDFHRRARLRRRPARHRCASRSTRRPCRNGATSSSSCSPSCDGSRQRAWSTRKATHCRSRRPHDRIRLATDRRSELDRTRRRDSPGEVHPNGVQPLPETYRSARGQSSMQPHWHRRSPGSRAACRGWHCRCLACCPLGWWRKPPFPYQDGDQPLYAAPTRPDRVGRMLAAVEVNGSGPYRFIIDLGANRSVLSSRLAASARTRVGRHRHGRSARGDGFRRRSHGHRGRIAGRHHRAGRSAVAGACRRRVCRRRRHPRHRRPAAVANRGRFPLRPRQDRTCRIPGARRTVT